jgi:Domain of unknown function (DUF4258)
VPSHVTYYLIVIDDEPLSYIDAQRRIRSMLDALRYTRHASRAMSDDALVALDVENILRAGVVDQSEYENREWRYRVRTNRLAAIVAFDPDVIVVVTVWRF